MIIIKNGALVTPQGLRRADLAMDGDKIVRIAAAIEPAEGDTVEDAAGCWVFPGFIGRDFLKNRGKMVQQSGGALVGPCGKMTQWLEQRAACVHWRGLDFCAAHIQAQVDILHRPSFSG